ncbi:unnamed protein product [Echinostoma caproni]|uniref:TLC domain-containing protein n=1 Tax=Echinostoma caproni TaxID=27848 RepID=A0A183AP99_9TREM|nr:unnamed protein product [Echinostoma caproni]
MFYSSPSGIRMRATKKSYDTYLHLRSDWHVSVFLCLLDNWSFYATGHQPTLADIPWDAAFAIHVGDHTTHVLPALLVLTHLFAGPLLVATSVPLCLTAPLIWSNLLGCSDLKRHSHLSELMFPISEHNAAQFTAALDRLCWRVFYGKSILTLGSVLGVGVLRRHLMVWKIFAPRLIFSIASLLVTGLALLLVRSTTVFGVHRAAVRYCTRSTVNITPQLRSTMATVSHGSDSRTGRA